MREKLVAGNWKMNTNIDEAINLLVDINNRLDEEKAVICVPFTHISVAMEIAGDNISIGAQNVSEYESGAYTGEVSAKMLQSLGVKYAIVGHSERRQYFNETDEAILQKLKRLLEVGISPIFCCGESLETRENLQHEFFVASQLENVLFKLTEEELKKTIIAYEPIWAIGTGKTASPQQAQGMHSNIRKTMAAKFGNSVAEQITILYGGSVKSDNAAELFSQPDIDGALVGGASLDANSFTDIIQSL